MDDRMETGDRIETGIERRVRRRGQKEWTQSIQIQDLEKQIRDLEKQIRALEIQLQAEKIRVGSLREQLHKLNEEYKRRMDEYKDSLQALISQADGILAVPTTPPTLHASLRL